MKATDQLKEEHRVIEKALGAVHKLAGAVADGKQVDPSLFVKAADFFGEFADRCHHGKEEDLLFPLMEKRGIPAQGGPLAVMLDEHVQGRAFVRAFREAAERYAAGDKSAAPQISENVNGYVHLLLHHIMKEDQVLYVMAERALSEADDEALLQGFEKVEHERMGHGAHERYHHLAEELSQAAAKL
jgi:hemerythrin-like domain-containing protein